MLPSAQISRLCCVGKTTEDTEYYDPLARRVLGRPVKHMVLVYFNLLNGLLLCDLIEMFKLKGGSPSMLKNFAIRYFQRSQGGSGRREHRLVTREREGNDREVVALSCRGWRI